MNAIGLENARDMAGETREPREAGKTPRLGRRQKPESADAKIAQLPRGLAIGPRAGRGGKQRGESKCHRALSYSDVFPSNIAVQTAAGKA